MATVDSHKMSIFTPTPYISKWQMSLCNNSSDNKSYRIHRVDVKVSAQVTTVTYMHQSQPSLHSGAGRSSEVERSLMVRCDIESILHGVDPLSYFSFQSVLHDWCNKGRGMCYPVCGMVHIKEPLLLIDKCSLYGGSGFPFSL